MNIRTLRFERDLVTNDSAKAVRRVQGIKRSRAAMETTSEASLALPAAGQPFHFTRAMSKLCVDVCTRVPAFRHIDMKRVLVTFARCRNAKTWGFQAKLVPMRFEGGAVTQRRGGAVYQIQKYFVGEVEMMYVLTFYLPRFQNQSFEEKLVTVFHELYHICPDFSGDIRRLGGKFCMHTHSQEQYDAHMAVYAREYLATKPNRMLFDFLKLSFAQIEERYGSIVGVTAPAPKLVAIG